MIYVQKLEKDSKETEFVRRWWEKDEFHQKSGVKFDELFADGTEAALVHDEQGPLIALRVHRSLRVAMQFRPESRIRIAKIGTEVVTWLKKLAKEGNMKEIIIRPGGKAENFSKKLGFLDFVGKILGV